MIQLDLNNPEFQANLLALAKPDACQMSWELIRSRQGPAGEQLRGKLLQRA